MGRAGRVSAWLLALVALLALLAVGGAWYVGTADFLRRAVDRAVAATGGRLTVEGLSGSIYRPMRADALTWRDGGATVRVENAAIDFELAPLLRGALRVRSLAAAGIDVVPGPPGGGGAGQLPDSLRLPIRVAIDDFRVGTITVARAGGQPPLQIHGLQFGLRYDGERYHFDNLVMAGEQVGLAANLSFADEPPYDIEAVARVATTIAGEQTAADLRAFGTPSSLQVELQGSFRDAAVSGTVRVAPLSDQPLGPLAFDVAGLDLSRLGDGLPRTRIDGRIEGEPAAAAASPGAPAAAGGLPPIAGSFRLRNLLPGPIDERTLPVAAAGGRFRLEGDRLLLDPVALEGPPGKLQGSVAYRIGERGAELRFATEALDLRQAHTALVETRLSGRIALRPDGDSLVFNAQLAEREISLDAQARLTGDLLSFEEATLKARDGVARFRGDLQVAAPFRFSLGGSVSDFDPSRFAQVPGGSLNGSWQASGQVQPTLAVTAGVRLVDSRWRGLALAGSAEGIVEPERVRGLRLDATLGGNRVTARGDLGVAGDRMAIVVDAKRLRELDERFAGSARVDGELRNRLERPAFVGTVAASDLRFEDRLRIGSLQASGSIPDVDTGPFELSAKGTGIVFDGRSVDQAALDASGTLAQHRLAARAVSRETGVDATVRAVGAAEIGDDWRWQGQLLEARQAGQPSLALAAPAELTVAAGTVAIRNARIGVDGPQGGTVVVERAGYSDGRIELQGSAARLPLRWLAELAPLEGVRTDDAGSLRVGARWNLAGTIGDAGSMKGQLALFRESGDIRIDLPAIEGTTETIAAGVNRADLLIEVDGGAVRASLDVQGDSLGTAQARAVTALRWLPDGRTPDLSVPLEGSVELEVPSLAWTRTLSGDAWRFDGSIQARLALSGTLAAPRASGRLTGNRLVAEQREFGMRLTDGELVADVRDNLLDIRTLRFASGGGTVRMSGALRAGNAEASDAIVTLERLPIPIGPGQRLVLSGEATASLRRATLRIRGRLRADEGVIELPSTDAPRLAGDIVVIRRAGEAPIRGSSQRNGTARAAARNGASATDAPPATAAAPAAGAAGTSSAVAATPPLRGTAKPQPEEAPGFHVVSDLEIELGDRLRVFGSGVDARLAGAIRLTGELPSNPRATGTVKIVQGTYTGFGQTLQIERGTLVFTGPVDDPAIDIVAYRRFLPVEAGVALTGTARSPRLELVSRPDVPEPDKLSWLVLGVGAETARSGGETSALQAAAATVLAARGSPLGGGSLASAFGLDVLSIRTAQAGTTAGGEAGATTSAQDSVVTLGKRLSDRLFVSYEQSLRGLQNLLRLQYEISDRLSVRMRAGTESSVDLLWTYRYD